MGLTWAEALWGPHPVALQCCCMAVATCLHSIMNAAVAVWRCGQLQASRLLFCQSCHGQSMVVLEQVPQRAGGNTLGAHRLCDPLSYFLLCWVLQYGAGLAALWSAAGSIVPWETGIHAPTTQLLHFSLGYCHVSLCHMAGRCCSTRGQLNCLCPSRLPSLGLRLQLQTVPGLCSWRCVRDIRRSNQTCMHSLS